MHLFIAKQIRKREAIFIQNKKGLINIPGLVFCVGRLKVYASVFEQYRLLTMPENMLFSPYSKHKDYDRISKEVLLISCSFF